MKYFGFEDIDDLRQQFEIGEKDIKDEEVLVASYATPSYEGDAFILFRRDGKLYEVNGSHCSCYGLEGQWRPEEAAWEELAVRPSLLSPSYEHNAAARALFESLVSEQGSS